MFSWCVWCINTRYKVCRVSRVMYSMFSWCVWCINTQYKVCRVSSVMYSKFSWCVQTGGVRMINLPGPQQLDWILSDGTLFPHSFCLPPVAGGVSGGRLGDFHPVRQVTRFTRGVFTDTPALTMRIKKKNYFCRSKDFEYLSLHFKNSV